MIVEFTYSSDFGGLVFILYHFTSLVRVNVIQVFIIQMSILNYTFGYTVYLRVVISYFLEL